MYRKAIGRDPSTAAVIDSGPLRLNVAEQRATLDGRDLELSPLLMRLLQILVEHPQQLISRQHLKQQLWPDSDRIDTERRLNTAMRALRSALADEADAPKFIETVRSHGYRWIASGSAHAPVPPRWLVPVLLAFAIAVVAVILVLPREGPAPADTPTSLVKAQASLDQWRSAPDASRLAAAERAIFEALRDSPSSPAAHVLRAQVALEGRWDWQAAADAYAEALDRDPSNADARLGLAWLKVNRGDNVGALGDANRMMLDSALSGDRRTEVGWLLIRAGRPDLASLACTESASDLNELSCAHSALAAVGQLDRARTAAVRLMRMREADPELVREIESMPAEAGYKRFLVWRARDFLPRDAAFFDRAQVLADAGLGTEALEYLDRSVAAQEPLAVKIVSSPSFMALRTHPHYQALVRKVGAVRN